MRTWKVSVSWESYACAYIDAETMDEAIAIAEGPDFPLPSEPNYVDGSFKVDAEMSHLLSDEPDAEELSK